MVTSTKINRISMALCAAQKAYKPLKKSGRGTIYEQTGEAREYAYSELQDVIEATREALAANNLAIYQTDDGDGKLVKVTTRLSHRSGQFLEGVQVLPIQPGANMLHAVGSSVTHARRYGMAALLGIASEPDLDAQAQGRPPRRAPEKAPQEQQQKPPAPEEPQAGTKPPPPMPAQTPDEVAEREFKAKFNDRARPITAILGTTKSPKWTPLEQIEIEADKLGDEAREKRDLSLLEVLLLRAEIADPYRKTEDWYPMIADILDLERDIEALKELKERMRHG